MVYSETRFMLMNEHKGSGRGRGAMSSRRNLRLGNEDTGHEKGRLEDSRCERENGTNDIPHIACIWACEVCGIAVMCSL